MIERGTKRGPPPGLSELFWRGYVIGGGVATIDTFIDMHSNAGSRPKCARFDVNPVPEAAGGKGSKGPTQFPEIRRETGLSERSKVRNKLSPGNASTAFSSSRLRTDATFKLSSPAANFQRVQTSRSGVTSYRENDSVRRVARSESREDAGCRHSRDRTGGKLLEIRFSTRRVTLP